MEDDSDKGVHDGDIRPEETTLTNELDQVVMKLKDGINAFRGIAERVCEGHIYLKEYIVRNGRHFNERPLGE